MPTLFLSHASPDKPLAREVHAQLTRDGYSVFLDERNIDEGSRWEAVLYQYVRRSRAFVVLLTASARESKWVFAEVTHARANNRFLLQVVLDDNGPFELASDRHAMCVEASDSGLADRIREALTKAGFPPRCLREWDGLVEPFPGFGAYREEHSAVFLGRERERERVLDALDRQNLLDPAPGVLITGPSGAGKTSLLSAGVLAPLRRSNGHWRVDGPFRPRDLAGLVRAFESANETRRIIALDQLEELVQLSETAQATFRESLTEARSRGALVLGTVRTAYVDRVVSVLEGWQPEHIPISAFGPHELLPIIVEACELLGWKADVAAVGSLAHSVGDSLPLASYALRRLWRLSGDGERALDASLCRELPPIDEMVKQVIKDRLGSSQPSPELRRAWLGMVERRDGVWLPRTLLARDVDDDTRADLKRLSPEIVVETERGFEPAHAHVFESSAWPELHGWLEKHERALVLRTELGDEAERWRDRGRARDTLWRGGRLDEALGALATEGAGVRPSSDIECEFLEASARAERWRRRALGLLAATLAALLVTSIVVGFRLAIANERTDRRLLETDVRAALREGRAARAIELLADAEPGTDPWYVELGNRALQMPRAQYRSAGVVIAHDVARRRLLIAGEQGELLSLPSLTPVAIDARIVPSFWYAKDEVHGERRAPPLDDERYNLSARLHGLSLHHAGRRMGALGPNGVATICGPGTVCIFGLDGRATGRRNLSAAVQHLAWTPEGNVLAIVHSGENITLGVELTTSGNVVAEDETYPGFLLAVDWSTRRAVAHEWSIFSPSDYRRLSVLHFDDVDSSDPDQDSDEYTSEVYAGILCDDRPVECRECAEVVRGRSPFVRARLFGDEIAATHENGGISVSGVPVSGQRSPASIIGHHEGVEDLRFSSDGERLITVGRSSARVWERGPNRWTGSHPLNHLDGSARPDSLRIVYGAVEQDVLVTADDLGRTWLWDTRHGQPQPLERYPSPAGALNYMALDGEYVVVSAQDGGTAVYARPTSGRGAPAYWRVEDERGEVAVRNGSVERVLADSQFDLQAGALRVASPDGLCLLEVGDQVRVYRWDGERYLRRSDPRPPATRPFRDHGAIACASRVAMAIVVSDRDVEVYRDGAASRLPTSRAPIGDVALDVRGERVAVAAGATVTLHSPSSDPIHLDGHIGPVEEVCFDTSGTLWSRGGDGWRSWILDAEALRERLASDATP